MSRRRTHGFPFRLGQTTDLAATLIYTNPRTRASDCRELRNVFDAERKPDRTAPGQSWMVQLYIRLLTGRFQVRILVAEPLN